MNLLQTVLILRYGHDPVELVTVALEVVVTRPLAHDKLVLEGIRLAEGGERLVRHRHVGDVVVVGQVPVEHIPGACPRFKAG